MMFCQTDGKTLKALIVLVFHLLLTNFCRGQSQLIGSSQPIVATLGDDIILPCHLQPALDAAGLTLEWTKPDLNPRFVHVWRDGVELVDKKHKSFEGRTSLFINELKNGNISLKLSKVKLSDHGTYRCFIPTLEKQSFVQLVVASGAASSPVISLAGVDRDRGGVVLQCESKGWYPEPEVFWLDGEGNLLSAGPTETVRGPDDLYTVSSRVTVEKRHNNNFTCRVQQNNINQIRETHIIVPDDFFKVQSSSFPVTVGLAVSLAVCIVVIVAVAVFFFVWKWRQNMIKVKRRETDTKVQYHKDEETVRQQLITDETVPKDGEGGKTTTHHHSSPKSDFLLSASRGEEMPTNSVKVVHEENQGSKEAGGEVETQTEKKETENKRLKGNEAAPAKSWFSSLFQRNHIKQSQDERRRRREKAEKEVASLKKELEASQQKVAELQKQNSYTTIQRSVRGDVFVEEVDLNGKYVRLSNKSNKEQQLNGWELQMRINDGEPIIFRFDSYKLKAGQTVTIWAQDSIPLHKALIDFVGWNQKSWGPEDRVLVTLFSCSGEEMAMRSHNPQHRQQT
ncbi:butyrophilin subfamily 2 member A2-like [Thunnus thynnus]|uniref:butyrophilin subfamily 2 member A2-like n=1 Tax=Thunnus thynnus TaxID=8237 RepID=UPI0035284B9C